MVWVGEKYCELVKLGYQELDRNSSVAKAGLLHDIYTTLSL
jgi:hypothetical protein